MGSICQNSNFFEHGHVAYQIKRNQGCRNMLENILAENPLPPPLTLGVKRPKLIFYRILSYQIKWILEFRNMAANILPTYLLPNPLDLIENMVLLHMKLNRIPKAATCKYFGRKFPLPALLTLWSHLTFAEHDQRET